MAINGTILGGAASFKWGGSLRWYDQDESAYAGIKASSTITSSVDYTLPVAPPVSDGYVLSSTTAGVLSWSTAGSGTVTGNGADNRIAVWSGAGSLDSDANFQYDSSLVAMSIGSAPSANTTFSVTRSGATTVTSQGAAVVNTTTSSTASISKYGLLVDSTGTWNGSGAVNYGIYMGSISGGTANWSLYVANAVNNYLGTGNTLIGTTTDNGAALAVLDSGTLVSPVAGTVAQFQASTAAATLAYLNVISGASGAAGITFGDTANSAMGWCEYDHSTDTLYLGANAAAKVSVNATADMTALNGLTALKPSTAYDGSPVGLIDGIFKKNTGGTYTTMARIEMGKENATDGNDAGYVSIYTRTSGGSNTKRVNVSSTGVVNISQMTASRYVKSDGSKNISTTETEPANTVFAGPITGADAVPGFRYLSVADIGATGSGAYSTQTTDATVTTLDTITPPNRTVIVIKWTGIAINNQSPPSGHGATIVSTYIKDHAGTLTKWGETFNSTHYGQANYLFDSAVSGANIILRVQNNSGDGFTVNWKIEVTTTLYTN